MSDKTSSWDSFLDAVILEIGDNEGWANFMKLLSKARACPIWFMIGARRIGKTDVALHIALMLWQKYHRKTMWVRDVLRTMEAANFQADFLNDAYEFGWIHDEDDKHTWSCKADGVHDPSGELVIKFQSL